jgi:hypothetical protein
VNVYHRGHRGKKGIRVSGYQESRRLATKARRHEGYKGIKTRDEGGQMTDDRIDH